MILINKDLIKDNSHKEVCRIMQALSGENKVLAIAPKMLVERIIEEIDIEKKCNYLLARSSIDRDSVLALITSNTKDLTGTPLTLPKGNAQYATKIRLLHKYYPKAFEQYHGYFDLLTDPISDLAWLQTLDESLVKGYQINTFTKTSIPALDLPNRSILRQFLSENYEYLLNKGLVRSLPTPSAELEDLIGSNTILCGPEFRWEDIVELPLGKQLLMRTLSSFLEDSASSKNPETTMTVLMTLLQVAHILKTNPSAWLPVDGISHHLKVAFLNKVGKIIDPPKQQKRLTKT